MSDARHRAREREASERAERIALLAHARRRGDVAAGRTLFLAAALDEPLARDALGLEEVWSCARLPGCVIDLGQRGEVSGRHDPDCPLPAAYNLEPWFRQLAEHGVEVEVRAALAVARRALEWWDRLQGWGTEVREGRLVLERRHYLTWSEEERHLRPRRILEAVERYVLTPSPLLAAEVASLPPAEGEERPFRYLPPLVGALGPAPSQAEREAPWQTVAASANFFPEDAVARSAICEALTCWVLGEGDPLRGIPRL